MLPLSLDVSRLRLALIGNGAGAARRLSWIDEAGAAAVKVYAATPAPELVAAAGGRLIPHWPDRAELHATQLVFIADVPEPQRSALAQAAHRAGAILHVEDVPSLCDAYAPAILRRGELMISVSTGGAAPGLAAELKAFLGEVFGPEWRGRIDEIKALRRAWCGAGANHQAIRRLIGRHLVDAGWIEAVPTQPANDRTQPGGGKGGQSCP